MLSNSEDALDADSLWLGTLSRSAVDIGPLPRAADVVIIGGGLLGVCCAYWLARMGRRPVLLERQVVASGATGRNSGLVIPTTAEPYPDAVRRHGPRTARAVRGLAVEGEALLAGVVDDERISCQHRSAGLVQLAADEAQAAYFADEIALSRADGFQASWLDRAALQRQIGTRLGPEIVGGMHLPGALVNSVALVDGIVSAARRYGARVHTGVEVTTLRSSRSGVSVDTTAGAMQATTVIAAVNAWLANLVPRLRDVVRPVQGQLIATAPLPPMFPQGMAAQSTAYGEYWQQAQDGTILLGGCRATAPGPPDPGAQRPQRAVHEALIGTLPRLFPDIGPIRAVRGWAGAMAFTPDLLPIVDEISDSVWAAGGFSGHGMPLGASIGRLLADRVASGAHTSGLAPFALDRTTLSKAVPHRA